MQLGSKSLFLEAVHKQQGRVVHADSSTGNSIPLSPSSLAVSLPPQVLPQRHGDPRRLKQEKTIFLTLC